MPLTIPLIKNNIIENVIIADYTDVCPEGYEFGPQLDGVFGIGWIFDGEKYINPKQNQVLQIDANNYGQIA